MGRNIYGRRLCCSIVMFSLFSFQSASSDSGRTILDPEGAWLTEKQDTVVKIEQCGDSLCGYIDWIHPGEEQFTASGVPLCNQKVLWDFEPSGTDGKLWESGRIYRPDKDKHYTGRIRVLTDETLLLRGYIGLPILGKSYTLTRVDPDEYSSCRSED